MPRKFKSALRVNDGVDQPEKIFGWYPERKQDNTEPGNYIN